MKLYDPDNPPLNDKVLPKPIRVFGREFTVEYDEFDRYLHKDKDGTILFDAQKIILDDGDHPELVKATLFHELLHVVDYLIGEEESRLTEAQVYRVANSLFGVLRDNPHLIDYLFDVERRSDG